MKKFKIKNLKLNRRKGISILISFAILVLASFLFTKLTSPVMAQWWSNQISGSGWQHRKQLTITNSSAGTLSSGTTIALTVDTQSLFNLSQIQSSCADLRLVYQDGTNITELTRFIDIPGGYLCSTSPATKVYFQLQASLTTGTSSTYYYLYYGNSQATAPTNTDTAFSLGSKAATLVCPFDGATTCAAAETASTATGSLRYSGSKSALKLSGAGSYSSAADSTSLSITGDLTAEAWVKLDQIGAEQTILGKWDETTANNDRSYRLYVTSANRFAFAVSSDGTNGNTTAITGTTTTAAISTWYHVAGVYDHAGKLDVYVNGSKDATQVTGGVTSVDDNNSLLYIGTKKNTSGTLDTSLAGTVDEVRVSDVIRYTANFTLPTSPFVRDTHTKLLYHFDEAGSDPHTANTAFDDSANGNSGTLTSATYVSGLTGTDTSTSDTGYQSSGAYAGHQGILVEEGTVNKITNPSFENSTYDTGWTNTDTQVGTATVVASAGTIVHASGNPTQSHLFYAENSGLWWLLYIESTNLNQLKSKYSSNLTSWTSGATLTLALNHDSDGSDFAAAYKNISSTDVVHVAISSYVSDTSRYNYHVRGTISGTTLSWGTEAIVGAHATASSVDQTDGPIVAYDSNNYVWVGTGFVNEPVSGFVGDNNVFQSTNADAGSSWTAGFQANPTEVSSAPGGTYTSRFMASLGAGVIFHILDNNTASTGSYTNLQTFKYDTVNCSGNHWCANVNAFASNISQQETSQWGAVAVSSSDIHLVSFTNSSTGAAVHRRYNGSSWSNGATVGNIPNLYKTNGPINGGNIFMSTDGTNVWMFAIESDTANSIAYNKWSAASNTWNGWTNFETSTQTRNKLSGYPTMKNGTIGVLWNQTNGANFDLVVKGFGATTISPITSAPYVKFGSKSAQIATSIAADSTYAAATNPGNTSTHTLSAYVYRGTSGSIGGTVDNTIAQLVFRGSAQSGTAYTNMGGGWWRLTYAAAAANASETYGVKVFHGETVYLDGIQLEQTAAATTYTDGSLGTGYFWNTACDGTTQSGTANADCSARTVTDIEYPATTGNIIPATGTAAFWLKSTWAGNDSLLHELLSVKTFSGTFRLYKDTDNSLKFYDGTHTSSQAVSWAANTWQNIAIDWGSNNMHLYINSSVGSSATGAYTAPTFNTSDFIYVGESTSKASQANAQISQLTIWNDILTSTQIADQYYSTLASHSEDKSVDAFTDNKGQNPIAVWHMDEGQGSVSNDASIYNHPLTLTNTTWNTDPGAYPTQRKISLKFNGTSAVAFRSWDRDFDFGTDPFTISGWFKHPTAVSGTDTILARYGSAGYKVYMNSSGYICFDIDSDSTWGSSNYDSACTTVSFADSKWHHFEAVKNTSSLNLYLDGQPAATDSSLAATSSLNSSARLYVGADSNGSSNYWDGFLDEITIYPYARTAAQVKADIPDPSSTLFGATSSDPLMSGLVAYWKMDETSINNDCSTPTVMDSSGNSNNAISCPAGTGSTGGSTGKFGNSVTLNGSTQSLKLSGDPFGDYPTAVPNASWGGWFNPSSGSLNNTNLLTKDTVFMLLNDSSGYLECAAYISGSWTYATTTSSLTTNAWNHVMCTYDGQTLKTFLNGNQIGKVTQLGNLTANQYQQLHFGESNGVAFFPGMLDEIRIYNRSLSSSEISQLYAWAPGPVGYWKLDENTGGSANDSSGHSYTGTWHGNGTHWSAGKFGSAGNFNGGNDYIDMGNVLNMGTNSMTASAWIKTSSTAAQLIISKSKSNAEVGRWFMMLNGDGNNIECDFTDNSGNGISTSWTTTAHEDNQWHLVTCVWNRVGNMTLYFDGVEKNHLDISSYSAMDATTSDYLYVGDYQDATGQAPDNTSYFKGSLDDVKIYNYPRTAKQIVQDMNGDHTAVTNQSMLSYWPFNEGYGTSTTHNTGNGGAALDGTLSGSTKPTWSNSGKLGKALSFNGSSASIQINGITTPLATGDYSLSIWFNPTTTFNSSSATEQDLLNFGDASSYNDFHLILVPSDGRLKFETYNSSHVAQVLYTTQNSWTGGTWYYVTITYGSASGMALYVNGVLISNNPAYSTRGDTPSASAYIGANQGTSFFYNGLIDEVKIYNYALSSSDVKLDYNQGSTAVMGSLSDTSQVTGTPIPPNSAQAAYCVPGDSASCAPPTAEWKMDERTGTSAFDTSRNNRLGTLSASGTTWVSGKLGSALKLDGSSGVITTGVTANNFISASAGTLEAWVYFTGSAIVCSGSHSQCPAVIGDSSGYFGIMRGNYGGTDNIWFLNIHSGSIDDVFGYSYSPNLWYHLAWVHSNAILSAYVNGAFVGSVATGSTSNLTGNLQIGRGDGSYHSGIIDNVVSYDYARTPAQIAWDYNRGAPQTWYKFDECSGSLVHDAAITANNTASGHDATITPNSGRTTGTCGSGVSTEIWNGGTAGKFGASVNLDGSGDYLTTSAFSPVAAAGTTVSKISWGGWFKPNNFSAAQTGLEKASEFRLNFDTNGKPLCAIYYSGAFHESAAPTLAATSTAWNHVVCTYDGSNLSTYLNGQLIKTDTSYSTAVTAASSILYLGENSSAAQRYGGQIDDVRIYNYSLTAAQVKTLYNENSAVRFGP